MDESTYHINTYKSIPNQHHLATQIVYTFFGIGGLKPYNIILIPIKTNEIKLGNEIFFFFYYWHHPYFVFQSCAKWMKMSRKLIPKPKEGEEKK